MAHPMTREELVALEIRELALLILARLKGAAVVNRKSFIAEKIGAMPPARGPVCESLWADHERRAGGGTGARRGVGLAVPERARQPGSRRPARQLLRHPARAACWPPC